MPKKSDLKVWGAGDPNYIKSMTSKSKPTAAPSASPTSKPRIAPMQSMTEQQRQEKALKDLMNKRAAVAKKTGMWPNYGTN